MSHQNIERVRLEKAKRNRKCYGCEGLIFQNHECILNVAASWHVNCFVLRVLELVSIKDIQKINDEEFEDYIEERIADKI